MGYTNLSLKGCFHKTLYIKEKINISRTKHCELCIDFWLEKKIYIDEVQKFEAAGRDLGVETATLKTWFDTHRVYPAVITSPALVQAYGAPQWSPRQQWAHTALKKPCLHCKVCGGKEMRFFRLNFLVPRPIFWLVPFPISFSTSFPTHNHQPFLQPFKKPRSLPLPLSVCSDPVLLKPARLDCSSNSNYEMIFAFSNHYVPGFPSP